MANRRTLLKGAVVLAALPVTGFTGLRRSPALADPFTLGVASGDPAPDGAVIWAERFDRPLDQLAELQEDLVLEVAGRPVAQVAAEARALRGSDNAMAERENIYALMNAAMMRGLGYAEPSGALRLKVRLQGGKVVERTLYPATVAWALGELEAGRPIVGPARQAVRVTVGAGSETDMKEQGADPEMTS